MSWTQNSRTRAVVKHVLPLIAFVGAPLATITALATPVTGTALPGTLTAAYPAAIALTSTTIGTPSSLSLNVAGGAILVSDNRGSTGGTWSTTATLSNFATVAPSSNTIPSSSVTMSPGSVIPSVLNPGGTSAAAGSANQDFLTPSTTVTFMSASGTGQGVFGLNPTFTWTVPANTVAAATVGTAYTATMTFTTQ